MRAKRRRYTLIPLIILLLGAAVVLSIPFLFRGKAIQLAKNELNNQLVADVDFNKLKISLLRDFPDASVVLNDFHVVGRGNFAADTLLYAGEVKLIFNLKSLFKGDKYEIKKFLINESDIFAHELADGRVNWDVFPPDSVKKDSESSLALKLEDVQLLNSRIHYLSKADSIEATLGNVNLSVSGDFTADRTTLKTHFNTDTLNFWNGDVQYAHRMQLRFDADIDARLKEDRYILQNNEMHVNAIPLSLNGWVQLLDESIDMDLKLETDKVDFKSLLSLIPAIYANSFDELDADGLVQLNGFIKGEYKDEEYPAFDLDLIVEDGRFKYAGLPKSADDINIKGRVMSPGGELDSTYIDLSNIQLSIGGNPISAQLQLAHPLSDPDFRVKAIGLLDLGMVKDFYPLEKGTQLKGLLDMDIDASGKMSYIEQNQYNRFRFAGHLKAQDLLAEMSELPQKLEIQNADLQFSHRYLNLRNLAVKLGRNDFILNGRVENYLAYVLSNKALKGVLSLQSDYLNINDFMGDDSDSSEENEAFSVIEVPRNLDIRLNGSIAQLLYDKMELKEANAQFVMNNGVLYINRMNVDAFDGKMTLNGSYNTQELSKPGIDFYLDLWNISIADIFKQVESLQKFAPIFEKFSGRFNSKLSLNSLLANDMKPILTSVLSKGSFRAEMLTLEKDVAALNELSKALQLEQLKDFSLKDLFITFDINDGRLHTKPFNLNLKEYRLNIGGSTGIDQSIDYNGTIRLPDKINAGRFQNVGFKLGGTLNKPQVKLDLEETLQKLVDEEKEKAKIIADSIKSEATEKAREELDKALLQAQQQADKILLQAKLQGDKLIKEAKIQGDSVVAKATNPITRELAKKAADELVRQAQKQADALNFKAKTEADKLLEKVAQKTNI